MPRPRLDLHALAARLRALYGPSAARLDVLAWSEDQTSHPAPMPLGLRVLAADGRQLAPLYHVALTWATTLNGMSGVTNQDDVETRMVAPCTDEAAYLAAAADPETAEELSRVMVLDGGERESGLMPELSELLARHLDWPLTTEAWVGWTLPDEDRTAEVQVSTEEKVAQVLDTLGEQDLDTGAALDEEDLQAFARAAVKTVVTTLSPDDFRDLRVAYGVSA